MNKTPVYLITGFLGSGKTTFLKNVIGYYNDDWKLAIVQNEFAPANIDGEELKRSASKDFQLLEVNNGSVFCVCLLSGFFQSLEKFIAQHNPDIIFLETSGLSDPISVGEIFNSKDLSKEVYLAGSVCIVDASGFLKLQKLQQRMIHQIQVADKIILNKTDINPETSGVEQELKKLNSYADILKAEYCRVSIEEILNIGLQKKDNSMHIVVPVISAEDLGRPDVKSSVFRSVKPLKKEFLQKFIEEISTHMIRLKGYILLSTKEIVSVQIAGDNKDFVYINRDIAQTELIGISFHISVTEIKELYSQYL